MASRLPPEHQFEHDAAKEKETLCERQGGGRPAPVIVTSDDPEGRPDEKGHVQEKRGEHEEPKQRDTEPELLAVVLVALPGDVWRGQGGSQAPRDGFCGNLPTASEHVCTPPNTAVG